VRDAETLAEARIFKIAEEALIQPRLDQALSLATEKLWEIPSRGTSSFKQRNFCTESTMSCQRGTENALMTTVTSSLSFTTNR